MKTYFRRLIITPAQVALALVFAPGCDTKGATEIERCLERLESKDASARRSAAKQLGELRATGAREPLERHLNREPDLITATTMIEALGQIGSADSVPILVARLEVAENRLVNLLERAVRGTSDPQSDVLLVNRLPEQLEHDQAAWRTLGKIGGKDALNCLLKHYAKEQSAPLVMGLALSATDPNMKIEDLKAHQTFLAAAKKGVESLQFADTPGSRQDALKKIRTNLVLAELSFVNMAIKTNTSCLEASILDACRRPTPGIREAILPYLKDHGQKVAKFAAELLKKIDTGRDSNK